MSRNKDGTFPKGVSGNPAGRKPIIEPIIQKAVEANRNAAKALILTKIESALPEWIDRIIEEGVKYGDAMRFKMLLELALGKMVDDQPDFPLTEEEKLLVMEFRRRKREQQSAGSEPIPGPVRETE